MLLQIGLLILTLTGVVLPLFLADPYKMIRTDRTKVAPIRHPSWKTGLSSVFLWH